MLERPQVLKSLYTIRITVKFRTSFVRNLSNKGETVFTILLNNGTNFNTKTFPYV